MRTSTESVLLKSLESSAQEFVSLAVRHQTRGDKFIVKNLLSKCSPQSVAQICDALASTTNLALDNYKKLLERREEPDEGHQRSCEHLTSLPKQQGTRTRRAPGRKRGADSSAAAETSEMEEDGRSARLEVLKTLHCCAFLASVGLTEGIMVVMEPSWLLPTVTSLHDSLVLLEEDATLQESIAGLCEAWWRRNLEHKENLIVQSVPFLLSKALSWGRKKDVQRLYSMRSALGLFDFFDESIEDMKHLLIRTVVTPTFLRTQPGRRFISYLFGLDPQLVKELVVIVRSQVPYGRKSILEAYGEILYQAWKAADGACRHEIEFSCIQGLYEAALHASSKALGVSIRTVLEGFSSQKAQDGVESMLFWLLEPLLFRALQAANSNVRQNALLVLVDVFPLEDPAASKEEKEIVLEKQFSLLEKLLVDPCPDVRVAAVKVVCRILRFFWEVIPSVTTVKFLTKIVDDMSKDSASHSVRQAVLQGIAYLLENAESHAVLKALLPGLGPLLNDTSLAVRVAAADLLLVIKGIRVIPFYKVVHVETLLSSLGCDSSMVAQRLTRLLLPSYFPPNVPVKEACKRCVVLLKRSPQAGAQFCKWLLLEGAAPKSLLRLVQILISLVKEEDLSEEVRSGMLLSLSEVSQSLITSAECKPVIEETFNGDMLAALMACAPDSLARSYVLQIATKLPAEDVSKLVCYCSGLCQKLSITPADLAELSAVHSLVLAWGGLDSLLVALMDILSGNFNMVGKAPTKQQRQNKVGSKHSEAAWLRILSTPSPSKQSQARNESVKAKFAAAVGAAWQVELLLAGDNTRFGLLRSSHLKELLQELKVLVQTAVKLAVERPGVVAKTCHLASPVLAYMKIHVHTVLEVSDMSEQENPSATRRGEGQRRPSERASECTSTALADISGDFETIWGESVGWLKEMLASATHSDGTSASPPPSEPKAKHPRCNSNRKMRPRGPLSPLSPNVPEGSKAQEASNKTAIEACYEGIISLVSKTVQMISDSFVLGLINEPSVRQASTDLVNGSIQWLREREQGNSHHLSDGLKQHWAHAQRLKG